MTNWLQKLLPTAPPSVKGQLPVAKSSVVRKNIQRLVAVSTQGQTTQSLPNAAIVYGVAAAVFLVAAIALVISGAWFSGLLVLLPTACFIGFAVHFIRHQ